MSKIRCLITALLLASAPALSTAQATASPEVESRGAERNDAGDARRTERAARAEARFKAADRNGDGKLTPAEMDAARAARRAERFAKMDTNRDGGLSREEMRQAREEHRSQRREHRGARREAMRERMQARLAALDVDHDQSLSRNELGDKAPRLAAKFGELDTDRNGELTREELRAGRRQRGDAPRER